MRIGRPFVITVDFNRLCNYDPGCFAGYRILDIGCGSGRHTSAAYQFEEVSVIGADINLDDVIETKNRLKYHDKLGEHGDGLWETLVTDITYLPFRNNFFDLVICSEVLEHIHDVKTAVLEIIRVLKPGKNLVVSVPRYLPERICWAFSEEYHITSKGHIRIFKKKELISLLEDAGLKEWAFHFAHSLHTPYWWLKCLVGPTQDNSVVVNLYHRFLVWDIIKRPRIIRLLDKLLNPLMGKSIVLYFQKL